MAHFELNQEFNGIEIYFDSKPSEDVLCHTPIQQNMPTLCRLSV